MEAATQQQKNLIKHNFNIWQRKLNKEIPKPKVEPIQATQVDLKTQQSPVKNENLNKRESK
jgi:hypothetical protein